jgi:amino-acid N-acetyltransferase
MTSPAGHAPAMSKAPVRVRVSKLQETQIDAVVAIDLAAKQAMHRAGVPAADFPARGLAGIAKLTKRHNVLVAEGDGVVVGYAAWRDESPGVAYLEDLAVKADLLRVGLGTRLLDAVREDAHGLALPVLVVRAWTCVAAEIAFLNKCGLSPLGTEPKEIAERVALWREQQEAQGGPGLVKGGQLVLVQSLL